MTNNNEILDSGNLLKRAYSCKQDEFEYLLQIINDELNKDKKNQDYITAKLVITSKMAVKHSDSK